MPRNTGKDSRLAREAASASSGKIPDGAFALRGMSVGKLSGLRKKGGLIGEATADK